MKSFSINISLGFVWFSPIFLFLLVLMIKSRAWHTLSLSYLLVSFLSFECADLAGKHQSQGVCREVTWPEPPPLLDKSCVSTAGCWLWAPQSWIEVNLAHPQFRQLKTDLPQWRPLTSGEPFQFTEHPCVWWSPFSHHLPLFTGPLVSSPLFASRARLQNWNLS